MPDGIEERKEREQRLQQQKREDREDLLDREVPDPFEPELQDS